MQRKGLELELRDLGKERLSERELDKLIGNRDYRMFLNPRNELYRKLRMAERTPSRSEALKRMAQEPNLIRRPVILCGEQVVLGYDEKRLKELVS